MLVLLVTAVLVAVLVLRSRPAEPPIDDEPSLRAALTEVVSRGDRAALDRLCRVHEQAIVDAFPRWAKRDPALGPPDRAEIDALAQLLGTVAQHMQTLGRDEPWTLLTSPPGGNPIVAWENDLARAGELEARERFDDAAALLESTLARTRPLEGSAADELRPMTTGRLGSVLFHAGRVEEAERCFEEALVELAGLGESSDERDELLLRAVRAGGTLMGVAAAKVMRKHE